MAWPQICIIVLFALSLYLHASKHGEPNPNRYNFWAAAAGVAVQSVLLYFGGFWS